MGEAASRCNSCMVRVSFLICSTCFIATICALPAVESPRSGVAAGSMPNSAAPKQMVGDEVVPEKPGGSQVHGILSQAAPTSTPTAPAPTAPAPTSTPTANHDLRERKLNLHCHDAQSEETAAYLQGFLGAFGAAWGYIDRWDLFCAAFIPQALFCCCIHPMIGMLQKKAEAEGEGGGVLLAVACVGFWVLDLGSGDDLQPRDEEWEWVLPAALKTSPKDSSAQYVQCVELG